jgi:hypothetical protein
MTRAMPKESHLIIQQGNRCRSNSNLLSIICQSKRYLEDGGLVFQRIFAPPQAVDIAFSPDHAETHGAITKDQTLSYMASINPGTVLTWVSMPIVPNKPIETKNW